MQGLGQYSEALGLIPSSMEILTKGFKPRNN